MPAPSPLPFDADAAKRLRQDKGLSRSEVADQVGVSPITVRSWELRHRNPSLGAALKVAEVLGVEVSELVTAASDGSESELSVMRRARRITAADMAHRVGVSKRHLQRVESGEALPSDAAVWARCYGLTPGQLRDAWKRAADAFDTGHQPQSES